MNMSDKWVFKNVSGFYNDSSSYQKFNKRRKYLQYFFRLVYYKALNCMYHKKGSFLTLRNELWLATLFRPPRVK